MYMETYSAFKGLVLPVLSALTFSTNGSSQFSVGDIDYLPTVNVPINVLYDRSFCGNQDSNTNFSNQELNTNRTFEIKTEAFDLVVLKSFAERYIDNLMPIEESFQAVIDDYFWEML